MRTGEWQLVERVYPFVGEHGENVCAEWHAVDPTSGETLSEREWFLFGRMNDMLSGRVAVDDPEAVAAARAGVSQVTTCEEAREFTRLRRERSMLKPAVVELDPRELARNAPDNEEFPDDQPAERVDKVTNSATFLNPPTVRMIHKSTLARCSAVLIGPSQLLTAAHCLPSLNVFQSIGIRVDYGDAQTQIPCINVRCTDSTNNAAAWPFPGYTGSGDVAHDLALVWADQPWLAPANTDASWSRILNQMTVATDTYYIEGYGWNANSGGSFGVGRRGNNWGHINFQNADWFAMTTQANQSRPCFFDSGGPANNQTYMIGKAASGFKPCALGVDSAATALHPNCPNPGDLFYYSRIHGKIPWLEANFVGGCYHGSSNGYNYIRCW